MILLLGSYWTWFYWFNTFAWALRGLAVNEFDSGKYDGPSEVEGLTIGESYLTRFGFVDGKGNAFTFDWAWWSVLYSLGISILSVIIASICLSAVRFATGKSLPGSLPDDEEGVDEKEKQDEEVEIPFQKVDLTFKDIHYYVTSSVGHERLELLKGIDGVVEAGKMTALVSIALVFKMQYVLDIVTDPLSSLDG